MLNIFPGLCTGTKIVTPIIMIIVLLLVIIFLILVILVLLVIMKTYHPSSYIYSKGGVKTNCSRLNIYTAWWMITYWCTNASIAWEQPLWVKSTRDQLSRAPTCAAELLTCAVDLQVYAVEPVTCAVNPWPVVFNPDLCCWTPELCYSTNITPSLIAFISVTSGCWWGRPANR